METIMDTEKQDRRVRKTKKAIKDAFSSLISEKSLDNITVKELSEKADINRKTFYNYYDSVYSLVDEIENNIILSFKKTLYKIDFKKGLEDTNIIFSNLNDFISQDIDFYGKLLGSQRNSSLVNKIVLVLKEECKSSILQQIYIEPYQLDLLVTFCVSGMIETYRSWFNSDKEVPLEKVGNTLSVLLSKGIQSFVKIN